MFFTILKGLRDFDGVPPRGVSGADWAPSLPLIGIGADTEAPSVSVEWTTISGGRSSSGVVSGCNPTSSSSSKEANKTRRG